MSDVLPGHCEQLVAAVADDVAELLVDEQESAGEILVGDADGRVFERASEPLLALAQRLLGPFEVGDVDIAADDTNRLALRVEHNTAARKHPAVHTVFGLHAELEGHPVRFTRQGGLSSAL